jgi:hypothetical protein
MIRFSRPSSRIFVPILLSVIFSGFLYSQFTVDTIGELRALSPGAHETVQVLGYYNAGDWGEPRTYRWTQPSSESDNGGTVIVPRTASTGRWIMEVNEGYYNVKWFGARGQDNPNHDDYIRIMNCIETAASSSEINTVFFPIGIYQINQRIRLSARHSGLTLEGENLAFKYEKVYPKTVEDGRVVRLTHPRVHIDWSPVEEFRVVDESNSAVLKRADGFYTAFWIGLYSTEGVIKNLTIKNIGFNGNRWDTMEIPYPNVPVANNIVVLEGSTDETVRFENVSTYLAPKAGFHVQSAVTVEDMLVYSTNFSGVDGGTRGGPGTLTYKNLEVHNCGNDEQFVNYHVNGKSYYGGFVGVNTGGNTYLENLWSHHNWSNKTARGVEATGLPSSRQVHFKNAVFEYNRFTGINHTGVHDVDDITNVYEDCIIRYNGAAGLRHLQVERVKVIGTLHLKDNGKKPSETGLSGLHVKYLVADKVIIEEHSEAAENAYTRSATFFGTNDISNLEIVNNQIVGLQIHDGKTTIRSGKIFNNKSVGISISNDAESEITNVKFGDTQQNPTQTRAEISGSGAILKYGNLDFTQSRVAPENRINVQNAQEIGAIFIDGLESNLTINSRDGAVISTLASHPTAHVIHVEFFANGTKIGERREPPYSLSWSEMKSGTYTITAKSTFSDNSTATSNSIRVFVSGSHSVLLTPGWNTISSYLEPDNTDVSYIFQDLKDNLFLVRDNTGQVYWPAFDINDIPTWDPTQGYEIFMDEEDTLTVFGMPVIPENTYIHLSSGWNLMAYLFDHPMSVEDAFKSILTQVQLVTNNAGEIYWPEYGVNSIEYLNPGEGYKIFVENPITFTYPETSPTVNYLIAGSVQDKRTGVQTFSPHYRLNIGKTGSRSVLLIESKYLQNGDEIGVWTSEDELVGGGVVINGRAAITIWGENSLFSQSDAGAKHNDPLRLTLWSQQDQDEYPLTIMRLRSLGRVESDEPILRFESNAVLVADVRSPFDIPERYTLEQNFPNPFNPTTTIRYTIPRDESITLEVYNLLGQKVHTLVDEKQTAGSYEVVFKADMLASGVYFYRLIAGNYTEIRRMILLR